MGLNILDRLQAKIELFRLEQRYTRRRHRRSTFVSNAIYVDGEYIYNSPNTTGSSANSSRSNNSNQIPTTITTVQAQAPPSHVSSPTSPTSLGSPVDGPVATKARKRLNRWSSMPGFGGSAMSARPSYGAASPTTPSSAVTAPPDWRTTTQQQRRSFSDMR